MDDPAVLAWAAVEGQVLGSHDVSLSLGSRTPGPAWASQMPGLIEVPPDVAIATAIEDLLLIAKCSKPGEWEGQVIYLPLR